MNVKIDWKQVYENGECPDCGDNIDEDAVPGDPCFNCGHVFWLPEYRYKYVYEVEADNYTATLIARPILKTGQTIFKHGIPETRYLIQDIMAPLNDRMEKPRRIVKNPHLSIVDAIDTFVSVEQLQIEGIEKELQRRRDILSQVKARRNAITDAEVEEFEGVVPMATSF
jgi:hypothetical protein